MPPVDNLRTKQHFTSTKASKSIGTNFSNFYKKKKFTCGAGSPSPLHGNSIVVPVYASTSSGSKINLGGPKELTTEINAVTDERPTEFSAMQLY